MHVRIVTALMAFPFTFAPIAFGQDATVVNCGSGESLQSAINAAAPGATLVLKGACAGPVVIIVSGLTLRGVEQASVNGSKQDAITINGARRTTLAGLTVSGGNNGIVGENGAQISLQDVTVTGNAVMGIQLESNSGATVTGGSVSGNGLNGIDVESTSSLTVSGTYLVTGNSVFGININGGSSLTLIQASLAVTKNILGIQLGTGASGFIADSNTKLNVANNATTGLTIVSGSHFVDFGGSITSTSNGVHGISIDSKGGLDLDAASLVTVNNNLGDGLHLEETSEATVFNNPLFSGSFGTSTVTSQGNRMNGISLLTNSNLTLVNFAALQVTGNKLDGVFVDDGSNLSFVQDTNVTGVQTAITGNAKDVNASFGSRITTLGNVTIGTATCDSSVLVRGPFPATCPASPK